MQLGDSKSSLDQCECKTRWNLNCLTCLSVELVFNFSENSPQFWVDGPSEVGIPNLCKNSTLRWVKRFTSTCSKYHEISHTSYTSARDIYKKLWINLSQFGQLKANCAIHLKMHRAGKNLFWSFPLACTRTIYDLYWIWMFNFELEQVGFGSPTPILA